MYFPTRLPAFAAVLLFSFSDMDWSQPPSHLDSGGRGAQISLVPHRHSIDHAENVRAFHNFLPPAAMSGLGNYDGNGAVQLSRNSEDGDDDFALPDRLPISVVRDDYFDCKGILYWKMMAWRPGEPERMSEG